MKLQGMLVVVMLLMVNGALSMGSDRAVVVFDAATQTEGPFPVMVAVKFDQEANLAGREAVLKAREVALARRAAQIAAMGQLIEKHVEREARMNIIVQVASLTLVGLWWFMSG